MSIQNVNAVTSGLALPSSGVTGQPALPQEALSKIEFKEASTVDADALTNAVNAANQMFQQVRPDIKFVIDESTNDIVIMLLEPETGDVINRYPTEQALAISNAIVESQARAAEQHEIFRNANEQLLGLFVEQRT